MPSPLRVLRRQQVAFGVRHQAEHAAGWIADPRDVGLRAVRVDRERARLAVGIDVAEHRLAGLDQALQDPLLRANEVSFAMGDGEVEPLVALEKRAFARSRLEVDPAVLEFAMGVVGERRDRGAIEIEGDDEPRLEQGLETVADAENQAFAIAKFAEDLAEKMLQLESKNFAGGDVITVGESAGDGHNLVLQKEFWIIAQALDVKSIDEGASFLEGELGLGVAVGAGGTEDENAGSSHGNLAKKAENRGVGVDAGPPGDSIDLGIFPAMSAKF